MRVSFGAEINGDFIPDEYEEEAVWIVKWWA